MRCRIALPMKRTTATRRWSKSSPTCSQENEFLNFLWCTWPRTLFQFARCNKACSVSPDADKVKLQLKELEASFAAQEDGGSASVVSKVNLWKVREQAALASGEKTVCHHPVLMPSLRFSSLCFISFKIYFSQVHRNQVGRFNSQKGLR